MNINEACKIYEEITKEKVNIFKNEAMNILKRAIQCNILKVCCNTAILHNIRKYAEEYNITVKQRGNYVYLINGRVYAEFDKCSQ